MQAVIQATVIYILTADDLPDYAQVDRNVRSINKTVSIQIFTVVY